MEGGFSTVPPGFGPASAEPAPAQLAARPRLGYNRIAVLMHLPSRTLVALLVLSVSAGAGLPEIAGFYSSAGASPGWPSLLRSLGLPQRPAEEARVFVVPSQGGGPPQEWLARLDRGAILILEGASPLAAELGFRAGARSIRVRSVRDLQHPDLQIVWERSLAMPAFEVPQAAQVFCRARAGGEPLVAGLRRGPGAVLWLAVSPGDRGFERFPFLPHALAELGLRVPFESRRLWAFFDAAYRVRDQPDPLAQRWREGGIAALHVGAWQYFESHPEGDEYLRQLIASCHRHNILVYAWLELPHVSDAFWKAHPAWREKTARLRDAYVPWRRLMNLANPDCQRAVAQGVRDLMLRFDWDGVNFAELYFDGVQGIRNRTEFTPMNDDVRRDVKLLKGFDPMDLFTERPRDPKKLRAFLDYRVDLAARLQDQWMAELEKAPPRKARPGRGADLCGRPLRSQHARRHRRRFRPRPPVPGPLPATFVVEDPATVWNLGPERYPEIARRYHPLTSHWDRVGVDINVVEREPPVYPTRTQVGAELFELIHTSSESFTRVHVLLRVLHPAHRPALARGRLRCGRPLRPPGRCPAHRLSLRSGNSLGRPCDSGRPPVARARP